MSATILCYHKVGPVSEEGRRLNIEPIRLRSHIKFFSRKRVPFVLARDLSAHWKKEFVCCTFDDAYASTMVHAPALFEEVGARATFYAVPGLVGGSSSWDGGLARPLADWDILLGAHRAGHEIGNHSFRHPHLSHLSAEAQLEEIHTAHEELTARGLSPASFCFPYGDFDRATLDGLRSLGYSVGLALGKRHAKASDDRLCLPRIVVAFSDALPMLMYKLYIKPKFKK